MLMQSLLLRPSAAQHLQPTALPAEQINTTCQHDDPVIWIYQVFDQCIYGIYQEVGFICGMVSILCWLSASLPQIVENYQTKKFHESVSIWFLLLWTLGDGGNLIGCLLYNEFPIQTFTAIYYITMDTTLIIQWYYYLFRYGRRSHPYDDQTPCDDEERRGTTPATSSVILACFCLPSLVQVVNITSNGLNTSSSSSLPSGEVRVGRSLLSLKQEITGSWTMEETIGYAIGCLSSMLYFGSRLPQIWKNFKRGETEGVSWMLFMLAFMGNTLYGSSILLQGPPLAEGEAWAAFLGKQMPWLVGSLGVLSMDTLILCQILHYRNHPKKGIDDSGFGDGLLEDQPLLGGSSRGSTYGSMADSSMVIV